MVSAAGVRRSPAPRREPRGAGGEHPDRPSLVATSAALRELVAVAERLAASSTPVLVQGESGTGKDLLAHVLHEAGPRAARPFLKVHCPSIPGGLFESELFGHERGAFTDA